MTEEKEKSSRLGVSVPQVIGAALAAVTAAFVGSLLGVYGTVLGAGVASMVTTVGASLYQRSIERTKEKVKVTVAKVPVKTLRVNSAPTSESETKSGSDPKSGPGTKIAGSTGTPPGVARIPAPGAEPPPVAPQQRTPTHRPAPGVAPSGQRPAPRQTPAWQRPARPGEQTRIGDQHTRVFRPVTPGAQHTRHTGITQRIGETAPTQQQWPGQDPDQTRADQTRVDPDQTRVTAPATSAMPATPGSPGEQRTQYLGPVPPPEQGEPEQVQPENGKNGKYGGKLKWSLIALTAGLSFVIAMLVVTGFEGITGRPVSGGDGGTSIGRMFTPASQHEQQQPVEQPAPVETTESSAPTESQAPEQGSEETTSETSETTSQQEPGENDTTTTQQPQPQPAPQPGGDLGTGGQDTGGE